MSDTTALAPAGRAVANESPQVEPSPSARRSWLPGWGPGVVLVVGLAIVAALVTLADNVDLHALHIIHADGAQTHEVTQIYIAGWLSPNFNPFIEDRLRLITPLLTILYLSSVNALGLLVVDAIRGSEQWPRVIRLFAAFLPGFLMVLAPLQVLYAAVGVVTASWIALVATPVAAVLVHRRAIVGSLERRRAGEARRPWLVPAATILGVLVVCALHRLQAGRAFMVPDSITVFLQAAQVQLQGGLGHHLAQWDQQSDEWVFNAPLMFTSRQAVDQLFAFWATQTVALASVTALIYGLVHSFAWRRRALAGALAAGAVLASTPAIYPWDNIPIVGGQNDVMWLAHPGRLVSVIAPWVALLLLGRRSRPAMIAILLATAGLAFTTVDGTGYTVVAVICAGAWHLLRGRVRPTARPARVATAAVVHSLALVALAAPLYVYYEVHHALLPDDVGWWLIIGGALAVLAALVVALVSRRPERLPAESRTDWRVTVGYAAAAAAALAAGFILSNNLVSKFADGDLRRLIGHLLPGFDSQVLSRGIVANQQLHFPSFTGQECIYSGHCLSFPYFLAVYGFTIVLALAGWLALGRMSDDENVNRRRAAWLIVVASFGLSFAIIDFTGTGLGMAWVLTRFVEVPYYAILGFAAITLVGSRSRFTMVAGTAVLAAWTIIPFLNSHVLQQWVKNADWLIARIG